MSTSNENVNIGVNVSVQGQAALDNVISRVEYLYGKALPRVAHEADAAAQAIRGMGNSSKELSSLLTKASLLGTITLPKMALTAQVAAGAIGNIGKKAEGLATIGSTLSDLQDILPGVAASANQVEDSFSKVNTQVAEATDTALEKYEALKTVVQDAELNLEVSVPGDQEQQIETVAEGIRRVNEEEKEANKKSPFQRMGASLKKLAKDSVVIPALKSMFQQLGPAMQTGIANMAGSWAPLGNAMSSAKASLGGLVNSFGSMLAPVLLAILPIFTQIINVITTAVNAVGMFFAKLLGRKTYTKLGQAVGGVAKGTSGVGSAAKKSAEDVKELDKATNTLGIDELNVLQQPEQSASDGGGGGGGGGGGDAGGGFLTEEVPLEDTASALTQFWDSFTAKLQPSVEAWGAAWQQIQDTAVAVWPQIQEAATGLWENGLAPLGSFLTTEFAPNVLNAFSTAFAPIVGDVISTALQVFADYFTFICGLWTEIIITLVIPALQLFQTIWVGLMEGIQAAWAEYGQPIMDNIILAFQNIWGIIMNLWETVLKPLIEYLLEKATVLWEEHLKPLWDNLVGFVADIVLCVLAFWNNVLAPLINWLIATFGPIFNKVFKGVGDIVFAVAGFISDCINSVITVFRAILQFVTAVFQGDWEGAWGAIGSLFGLSWDDMYAGMKDIVNKIIGAVNKMIKGVESGINWLIDGINSAFDFIRGIANGAAGLLAKAGIEVEFEVPTFNHVSLGTIPLLASGAVLTQRTLFEGGEYPGARTNPEIVSPLSMMKGAFRQALAEQGGMGGSFTAEQPIELSLDGDVFYRAMVKIKQNRGVTIGSAFAEAY